ncbi:UvrD-helicase domain-containing protein [Gilvimarinus agarilyticus]|uniref:UvrD-helicase domain-containing protein n=1 Tax=Gilvimarinus agarilyticus TaxID=679259 RepID=UPI000695BD54|nr:UvrD-helicase domain-containing protein [Gilvimarinus agarilyticus]
MEVNLPKITDDDIAWVVSILGLPDDAFSTEKDGGARERILKSVGETLDVSACPGSGKTTLLVAKLAILARNWPYRRKGMCVLSHTNVAKEEIEKRLGGTEVGQALLSYPHYIGTIHGFVNEFLALPWLRSKGFPIKVIDSEIAYSWRWDKLYPWTRENAEKARVSKSVIKATNSQLSIGQVPWGKGVLGIETKPYLNMSNSCRESIQKFGIHTHDEMFMWANDLIDCSSTIKQHLRDRFPLVFLDEVQDNSEAQSSILHRIFMEGDGASCRMRFGDSDQAIFDHAGKVNRAKTDKFPLDEAKYDLPNSHRFGQSIAHLASPLSIGKMSLAGQGPKFGESKDTAHAIFLVDEASTGAVLKAYGQYLLSVFDEEQALLDQLTFTAVGGVHRDKEGAEKYRPHNVSHYCAEYDPDITNKDPKPKTFLQYVKAGHRSGGQFALEGTGGESFTAVERIAIGIINFSKEMSPQFNPRPRKRNHRFILESLKDDSANYEKYLKLVSYFAVDRKFPSEADWSTTWRGILIDIVTSLSSITPRNDHAFLHYQQQAGLAENHKNTQSNTQVVEGGGRKATIRLGSIHSVKGETHTATLVLDTYNISHHLKMIFPWIKGKPKKTVSDSDEKRLKLHYVAMTRPSHLLCLAIKKSTLEKDGTINKKAIDELKSHGWGKVAVVDKAGNCEWL